MGLIKHLPDILADISCNNLI